MKNPRLSSENHVSSTILEGYEERRFLIMSPLLRLCYCILNALPAAESGRPNRLSYRPEIYRVVPKEG